MLKNTILFIAISLSTLKAENLNIPDSTTNKLAGLSGNEKVKLLTDLAWNLREKETDLALRYSKLAVILCDSLNLTKYAAKAYNFVGVIYTHYKYDAQNGITYLRKGLEYAIQENDSVEIGYSYNNLGDVYYLTGNTPLAFEYSQKSIDYFEKLKNNRGIAYSYINLGVVYRYEKEFELSLNYFNKAIELRQNDEFNTGIASALLEVGRTYYAMKDLEQALEYFTRSLELHRRINNIKYTAFSLNGIGDVYYTQGRYSEALKMYDAALKLNTEKSHEYGIVDDRLGKALVYSKMNMREKGEQELSTAIETAGRLGLRPNILKAYETSPKFYLNLNDFDASSKSFDRFLFIYDSLFSIQQFETLSEIENRFQISRKLEATNRELEIKTGEERNLVILILFMIVLFGVFIWRYRATKILTNKLHILNESKDKLFAIIAHDLKNPFGALIGFGELLEEDDLTEDERKEYTHNLNSVIHDTFKLLENLLNLSATKTGKLEYSPREFNLAELIDSILGSMSMIFKNKSLMIDVAIDSDNLYADPSMIEITLRNLLTNAVKFSNPGGTIRIKSGQKNGNYILSVADEGIGMDKETREELFASDFVKSNNGTAGEKGTGIGLSLCNELIKKHSGKIDVDSAPGEGSRFTILIPADN